MGRYGIVDLAGIQKEDVDALLAPYWTRDNVVDVSDISSQLRDIRDSLAPLIDEDGTPASTSFGLRSVEISLALSLEGKVMFVAKGSVDASIKLSFGRR
ncbi:hypothetical protein Franean1_0067 [Parafrankia sp. EAN1pec]|nr:hypothetical protein Franean1_0067 [Frankia sp. EAN1pec]